MEWPWLKDLSRLSPAADWVLLRDGLLLPDHAFPVPRPVVGRSGCLPQLDLAVSSRLLLYSWLVLDILDSCELCASRGSLRGRGVLHVVRQTRRVLPEGPLQSGLYEESV